MSANQAPRGHAAIGSRLTLGASLPPTVARAALGERVLIVTEAARDAGRALARIIVGLPICLTNDVAADRARAARACERYPADVAPNLRVPAHASNR